MIRRPHSIVCCSAIIWLLIAASGALAVDSPATRETLKGLQGVYVIVEEMQPNIQRYAVKPGLAKDQLQKDVESRLRQKGIRVLSREEWMKAPGKPVLYLAVNTHETEKYQYAYDIKVELQQVVKMEANPRINALAATWSMNMTGMADVGSLNLIKGDVNVLVGRFQDAYLAANSKKK